MKSIKDLCDCRIIHEKSVESAKLNALDEKEFVAISQLFKALGDTNRLRILWALEGAEMCVCDLAAYLGVTESAVSHQLRILRQLQLVKNRREGPVLYYSLNDAHVTQLMHLAMEHVRE